MVRQWGTYLLTAAGSVGASAQPASPKQQRDRYQQSRNNPNLFSLSCSFILLRKRGLFVRLIDGLASTRGPKSPRLAKGGETWGTPFTVSHRSRCCAIAGS